MRDTGRGLRAEQWARYCGRYTCADVIEKYARSQLLSKTASYGNWGGEPELGKIIIGMVRVYVKIRKHFTTFRF